MTIRSPLVSEMAIYVNYLWVETCWRIFNGTNSQSAIRSGFGVVDVSHAMTPNTRLVVGSGWVLTVMHHSRCCRSVEDDSSRVPLPGG